ncbi:hypothetical protein [Micromonospora sp. WMMD1082]|uniref:hypothetical protein n=1 Tax=Micromonospora sp. WMMD1082 TaxID=3016104 RepID=UPI003241C418
MGTSVTPVELMAQTDRSGRRVATVADPDRTAAGTLVGMRAMDGGDVDQAVAEMMRVLRPHEARDWDGRAGTLEWSCRTTAAHVAHDLLAYAGQVAGRPDDAYLPFDLVVRDDAAPRDVLNVVTARPGRPVRGVVTIRRGPGRWHVGPRRGGRRT